MLSCFLLLLFVGLIILLVFRLEISLLLQNRSHYLKNSLSVCAHACVHMHVLIHMLFIPSSLENLSTHMLLLCWKLVFPLWEFSLFSLVIFKTFYFNQLSVLLFQLFSCGMGLTVYLWLAWNSFSAWRFHKALGFSFFVVSWNLFSLRWIIWNTGYIVSLVVNSNSQDT